MKKLNFINHYNSAILAYKSKNIEDALFCIEKSLEYEPKNYQALHLKALIFKNLEKYEEASHFYGLSIEYCDDKDKVEKLIKLKEEVDSLILPQFLDDLIDIDFNDSDSENSKATKPLINENNPINESIYNEIDDISLKIQTSFDSEEYLECIKYIDKIFSYLNTGESPKNIEDIDQFYVVKAYALYNLGETEEIDLLLKRALDINPKNSDAKDLLNEISALPSHKINTEKTKELTIDDVNDDISIDDGDIFNSSNNFSKSDLDNYEELSVDDDNVDDILIEEDDGLKLIDDCIDTNSFSPKNRNNFSIKKLPQRKGKKTSRIKKNRNGWLDLNPKTEGIISIVFGLFFALGAVGLGVLPIFGSLFIIYGIYLIYNKK